VAGKLGRPNSPCGSREASSLAGSSSTRPRLYWPVTTETQRDPAFHVDAALLLVGPAQFLPHAIEWVWKGYAPKKDR
jgi:hypothetical protein